MKGRSRTSIGFLFRTSRPLGWVASFSLFRIGMEYGSAQNTFSTVGLSIVLTFPFCLYLFGLNDIADRESDIDNPRKGNWIHGASSPEDHDTLARWSPWIGGGIVALFVPLIPFAAGVVLAFILIVSWAYSTKPFRLKEIPIVDGLTTASIMIGLLCVGFLTNTAPSSIPYEAVAVAPCLVGLHIFASVVDLESDRKANHRTLAVRAGPRIAGLVAIAFSMLSTISIAWLDYVHPIAVYLCLQPSVFIAWLLLGRRMTARRAISIVGAFGIITLVYLAVYLMLER